MNIPINTKAPVQAGNQIEIDAPVDLAWKILADIPNWPKWQKAVSKAIVHGKVEEGTAFSWKAGGLNFKSSIHTARPSAEFGWTGVTFGASAIHNWTFEGNGARTIVRVEESLEGLFPWLLKGYFRKNLEAGILANLKELKAEAEAQMK